MENTKTISISLTIKELDRINTLLNHYVLSNGTDVDLYDDGMKIKSKILDAMFVFNTNAVKAVAPKKVATKNINELSIDEVSDITGVEFVYVDDKPNTYDFYDDMIAHVTIGKFRFAVDIDKENDASVRRVRKDIEKSLRDANISFIS